MASQDASPNRAGTYATLGGRSRRWRPPARPVIAGLLALEALLASAFVIWPPMEQNRTVNAVIAAVLVAAALGCAVRPSYRGPLWLVETWLVVAWMMPMIVIATRTIEASQLLWADILILVAIAAAFYLPARRAAYQVVAMVVCYAVAALTFDPRTRLLFVVGIVVLVLVCAFVLAALRRDRDRAMQVVAAMATTDPLTGLLNRRGLELEASIVRSNAARAGRATIVALVDLDALKEVNDTKGHEAGDAFIARTAAHWRASLREGDLVARVGGDEFVAILPQADESAAADLLTRIRENAPAPWSHGWTVWGTDEPLDAALERADALMYADKAERRTGRA